MKIRFVSEIFDREVELIGKVLCTRSVEYDMSWEFQDGKEYNLYKQLLDDNPNNSYIKYIYESTTDEKVVKQRIELACGKLFGVSK